MKRGFLLLFFLISVLAPSVFALDGPGHRSPPQKPVNEYCPVMQGEKVDPDVWIDYDGKRIWFCCQDCRDTFKSDPTSYLAGLPQFAPKSAAKAPGGVSGAVPADPRPDPEKEYPLGALHPMMVHFPIALTMAALFAAILGLFFSGEFLKNARTWCIVLAALFVVPTFLLGGQAMGAMGRMSSTIARRVHEHQEWGETSLWVLLVVGFVELVYFAFRTRSRITMGLGNRLANGPQGSFRRRISSLLTSKETVAVLEWLGFTGIVAAAIVIGITGWHGAEVTHGAHHLDPFLHLLGLK